MRVFDVTTGQFLEQFLDKAIKSALLESERVGLDIETYTKDGADWEDQDYSQANIRLFMVYLPTIAKTVIIDFYHVSEFDKEFLALFKEMVEKPRGLEIVIHNAKYEYQYLRYHLGIILKRMRCTMVCNQLLDGGLFYPIIRAYGKTPNTLEMVAHRRLGVVPNKQYQESNWSELVLSDEQWHYAALDPFLCYAAYDEMLPRLLELGDAFKIEMSALNAFSELEYNGVFMHIATAKHHQAMYLEVETALSDKLQAIFQEEIAKQPCLINHVASKAQKKEWESAERKDAAIREFAASLPPIEFKPTKKLYEKLVKINSAYANFKVAFDYANDKQSDVNRSIGWNEIYLLLKKLCVDASYRQLLLTKSAQSAYAKWLNAVEYAKTPPTNVVKDFIINVRSVKQIKPFLEHLVSAKLASTDDEHLADFHHIPFVEALLEYRHIRQLRVYLDGYIRRYRDGSGRAKYSQLAMSSIGRSSSSEFNAQNVPTPSNITKKYKLPPIREIFALSDKETAEGIVAGLLDAAGSHLQIGRDLSGDPNLLKAVREGIKVHYITVSAILALDGIKITPEQVMKAYFDKNDPNYENARKVYAPAKTVVYAFLNLSGARRLMSTLLVETGKHYDLQTCEVFLNACRTGYKGLWDYIQKELQLAKTRITNLYERVSLSKKHGKNLVACGLNLATLGTKHLGVVSVLKTLDGRVLNLELISRTSAKGLERTVDGARYTSAHWLSVEASAMKMALARLQHWSYDYPEYQFKLRGFAHDEIVFSCYHAYKNIVGDKVHETLVSCFRYFSKNFKPEFDKFDGFIDNWSQK